MRDIIIAGNWKMNKNRQETKDFAEQVAGYSTRLDLPAVRILIAPPYPFLCEAISITENSPVAVAAQEVSYRHNGAFTGEVSAAMLSSIQVPYCIIGHSERRQYHHETDANVKERMQRLFEHQITPIVCIGETLGQRDAGETAKVVLNQLQGCFAGIEPADSGKVIVAYEPVWAIGTGRTATPQQAQEVHHLIRQWFANNYKADIATGLHILYGGSVRPDNIMELLSQADIDGGLIGGASLDFEQFTTMIQTAADLIKYRTEQRNAPSH